MKRKSHKRYPLSPLLPVSLIPSQNKKVKKSKESAVPAPPSEEVIMRLNALAHEYPFCIYYHEKRNDPL